MGDLGSVICRYLVPLLTAIGTFHLPAIAQDQHHVAAPFPLGCKACYVRRIPYGITL